MWKRFIEIHNQFHVGSGTSFLDLLMEASRMESLWRADCQGSGMSNLAVYQLYSYVSKV